MIPEPMRHYPQFILTANKVPVGGIDPHDPHNWSDYNTIVTARQPGQQIAFVLTRDDPFYFIDIDHCYTDGQWSNVAVTLCQMFTDAAVQVSTSNTGLHIIGTGSDTVPDDHRCKNQQFGLEFYTHSRILIFSDNPVSGDASARHDVQLQQLLQYWLPGSSGASDANWTTTPDPDYTGTDDDAELIRMMLASKQSAGAALGGKPTPQQLWDADATVLARAFPHAVNPWDYSSADAALLSHLAFWTGRNCERMDRLFRQSKLMRDKWLKREDYRIRSCTNAIANCSNVLQLKSKATPVVVAGEAREGYQYMTYDQQQEHFRGCCYVRDIHRVFTPDGALLKPEQFKAMYGGFVFQLDSQGVKTTKNAFEAFTESQCFNFPKVIQTCFRPETGSGNIINHEGKTMINTYVPIETNSSPGDAGPFLDLISRILPNPDDQLILLAYCAALVQYPGTKFQWSVVLQGTQGNGKSFIGRALSYCVGEKYTHYPNAQDIGSKFNGWLQNKLLIVIEELYVADRRDMMESLKPLITDDRIEIQSKGVDQVTGDNRANFLMNTNHRDGIIKTTGDRRFCVMFCAQQEYVHLARGGMNGNYFPDLYDWFRNGGNQIINNYLSNYDIPDELNPAKYCHRAPASSSTSEVLAASMGPIEQDLLESVSEGRLGFCGGFISSMQVNNLIKEGKIRKVSQNKLRDILHNIGYVPHPALPDGRVNNPIIIDKGKPRLYVKKDHPAAKITHAPDVVKAYERAQNAVSDAELTFTSTPHP